MKATYQVICQDRKTSKVMSQATERMNVPDLSAGDFPNFERKGPNLLERRLVRAAEVITERIRF